MATLAETLREAVAEVFLELEDVPQLVGYKTRGASTYNTTTGDVTKPEVVFSLPAVLTAFKYREIDGERVRIGDKRLLVERSVAETRAVAAGTTFAPKLDDAVLIDSAEYVVFHWETDPVGATVDLWVRRAV